MVPFLAGGFAMLLGVPVTVIGLLLHAGTPRRIAAAFLGGLAVIVVGGMISSAAMTDDPSAGVPIAATLVAAAGLALLLASVGGLGVAAIRVARSRNPRRRVGIGAERRRRKPPAGPCNVAAGLLRPYSRHRCQPRPPDRPIDETPSPAQLGAPVDAEAATTELVPRLVVGVGIVVILVFVLGVLAAVVQDQEVNALDTFASPFVHSFASPVVDSLMLGASTVGSVPSLLVLAAVTAAVALSRRRPGYAGLVAVAAVGVVLVNEVLKRIVGRPRPKLDWAGVYPDFSFPSGHTMDSIVVLVAVAFVVWALFGRRVGIVATGVAQIGLALLIGFSRIYLGAHYLTDVIGGYIAGAIWLVRCRVGVPGGVAPSRARGCNARRP